MRILALVHEPGPCSGVFADVAGGRGAEIEEWSLAWGTPPPRPLDEYGAVLVFGGVMHVDQEHYHPWLREENLLIQRLLDQHVPLLGVCLGGQLIAKAVHTPVVRSSEPEVGWVEVGLTREATADPVFGALPASFTAYEWHYYRFELPAGAAPLARSATCLQAFRLGELAWGLQFHCEVSRETVLEWIETYGNGADPDLPPGAIERMRAETDAHVGAWTAIGREIASRFLDVAAGAAGARQRAATTSRSAATAGRSSSRSVQPRSAR